LEKGKVPFESYILHLAVRIEILTDPRKPVVEQKKEVSEKINSYSGTLFHPRAVEAFKRRPGRILSGWI
jgi:response regulator RpfG family c-di-GMP phosphodiesterase